MNLAAVRKMDSDPKSFDSSLVGGKAANLSRLAGLCHRVPDGFSLPVTVMNEAHPLDLWDEITRAISDLTASKTLLQPFVLPSWMKTELRHHLRVSMKHISISSARMPLSKP